MPQPKVFKDQRESSPNFRKPAQSASNVIVFHSIVNSDGPQRPDPAPLGSCSRPSTYVLDDYRDNILLAARRGRNYRSIAAQYGVSALEIWRIVTESLQVKKAA